MMSKFVIFVNLLLVCQVIPIIQQGEEIKENNVSTAEELNQCMSGERKDLGVCFGKELLSKLNSYNEADTFSLANGVTFVRDEKTPRDFASFLDKDPMDFRSMMEDASNLISKRSLHWDLSGIYPGLVMRIGPTLANGVLEFVMDPRVKDRAYNGHYQPHGEMSTGRLLARNLLVPFLLGFKFQISTLLPILLGLVLLASKKAFFLAKLALLAATLFSGGSNYGSGHNSLGDFGSPTLASYTNPFEGSGHYHGNHGFQGHSGGFFHHRNPQPHPQSEYFFRDKADKADTLTSTATPITPDELRDRLERLFITKKDMNMPIEEPREHPVKVRNARHYAWTPMSNG